MNAEYLMYGFLGICFLVGLGAIYVARKHDINRQKIKN